MKLFKRLMAVALAGMMALTVLTGCSSVNEKEFVAILNDALKTPLVAAKLEDFGIKEFKAADSDVNHKTAAVAEIVRNAEVKEGEGIDEVLTAKHEDIRNALVGKNDTNKYIVSYATKVTYGSKLFQTFDDGLDVVEVFTHLDKNVFANKELMTNRETKDATALVGFTDVNVNGKTYTLVVMKVPTVEKTPQDGGDIDIGG